MKHKIAQVVLWLIVVALGCWAVQQLLQLNQPNAAGVFSRAGAMNLLPLVLGVFVFGTVAAGHGAWLMLGHFWGRLIAWGHSANGAPQEVTVDPGPAPQPGAKFDLTAALAAIKAETLSKIRPVAGRLAAHGQYDDVDKIAEIEKKLEAAFTV